MRVLLLLLLLLVVVVVAAASAGVVVGRLLGFLQLRVHQSSTLLSMLQRRLSFHLPSLQALS